jgi:hypothetical protein
MPYSQKTSREDSSGKADVQNSVVGAHINFATIGPAVCGDRVGSTFVDVPAPITSKSEIGVCDSGGSIHATERHGGQVQQ